MSNFSKTTSASVSPFARATASLCFISPIDEQSTFPYWFNGLTKLAAMTSSLWRRFEVGCLANSSRTLDGSAPCETRLAESEFDCSVVAVGEAVEVTGVEDLAPRRPDCACAS